MPLISFLKIDTFLQLTGMHHSSDYFEIGVDIDHIHSAVIHEGALGLSGV